MSDRHYEIKAALCNGPLQTDGVLYIADDFRIEGSRQKRIQQRIMDERAVRNENVRLNNMKRGDAPTSDVPDWAIGAYHA